MKDEATGALIVALKITLLAMQNRDFADEFIDRATKVREIARRNIERNAA